MLNGEGSVNGIKINKSKYQKNKFARAARSFVHFFAIVLHDYNVWRNCRMCLPKILFLVFMFASIFSLSLIFTHFFCWPLAFLIFPPPL